MIIPIHYADEIRDLFLPDSCRTDLFASPEERLRAINNDHWLHTGKLPSNLSQFLKGDGELLIVVNDHFRSTPTATVIRALLSHLDLNLTTFLVATALHPAPEKENLRVIFGGLYDRIKDRVQVHDAGDKAGLARFATDTGDVWLNKLLDSSARILTISSVEPHYFAGFTGGRKIIFPGCASFADTRANHALAVTEGSRPLATVGNPVWEDIKQRTACLDDKRRFTIQLVAGHGRSVLFASWGDWDDAYEQSADFVRRNFAYQVDQLYDCIICVVYPPLDRNLYQLQKSYENVAAAVRDGGTILLISACLEGIGDERFLKLAEAEARGEKLPDEESEVGAMGVHKIRRTVKLAQRLNLRLLSTLTADTLTCLPIEARKEINSSIDELIKKYGKDCRVAVVLDSATQVLCGPDQAAAGSALTMEEKNHA